jgi:hypothetical protein
MIEPGSVGDWLQASLMAGALGGLTATGRWALRMEEAERAIPHAVSPAGVDRTLTPTPERTPGRRGP